MIDKEDLHGSRCSTLTNDQRARIEQADDRSKKGLTVCGQYALDSDDYLARCVGTIYKTAYSSGNRDDVKVRLDWCDHGHTTHYFVDGWHVAGRPSSQVAPRDYLRSIWSAGRVIAHRMTARRREEQSSS